MINIMDPKQVRFSLDAVAKQVEVSDQYAAQRLKELGLAVVGGPYADAWSVTNIYHLLEPEAIVSRYKTQRYTDTFITLLEWFRNSFILVPLIMTWLGISQAVTQYSALIKADPGQITQPFLFLWQQGFGNRLSWIFTLGGLATVDAILLAVILALTFLVYFLSNVIKFRREQEAEEIRNSLMHALAGAALCLATRKWTEPTNFVDRLDKVTAEFNRVTLALLGRVNALADRQDKELQTFIDFKKDLAAMMSTVTAAANELKTSTQSLRTNITALLAPMQQLASNAGTLLTSTQEAVALLKVQIASEDTVVKAQEQWGKDLKAALTQLDTTTKTSQKMADKVSESSKKLDALVTSLEREHQDFKNVTGNATKAATSMEGASMYMMACVKEMRGVAQDMDNITRRIAVMLGLPSKP